MSLKTTRTGAGVKAKSIYKDMSWQDVKLLFHLSRTPVHLSVIDNDQYYGEILARLVKYGCIIVSDLDMVECSELGHLVIQEHQKSYKRIYKHDPIQQVKEAL